MSTSDAGRVAEIRERVGKATQGPWRWIRGPSPDWGHRGPDLVTVDGKTELCPHYCLWVDEEGVEHRGAGPEQPHEHFRPRATILSSWGYDADGLDISDEDRDFVAHARMDVPWLLDRLDALEAALRAYMVPAGDTPEELYAQAKAVLGDGR